MIRGNEVRNPRDHGGLRKTIAGRTGGIVFNIQHAGKGDAVAAPTAAMRKEEVCLCGARAAIGVRKVVATPDEVGSRGAVVVR